MSDFSALGPWNHLESMDIRGAHFFDLMDQRDVPMLKALTLTLLDNFLAHSIAYHWRHWTVLEDLTFNLDDSKLTLLFLRT